MNFRIENNKFPSTLARRHCKEFPEKALRRSSLQTHEQGGSGGFAHQADRELREAVQRLRSERCKFLINVAPTIF